jgi:hypothetical protein
MPIVGAVLGAVGIATSLFGGIFGGASKKDALYAAADLKYKQAQLNFQQSQEQIRRETIATGQAVGQARGAMGASGFWAGGGSMAKYVQAFTTELQGRLAYERKIAQQQLQLGEQAKGVEKQAADAGLVTDITGAVGGALQGAGSMFGGMKFGQTAPTSPAGLGG